MPSLWKAEFEPLPFPPLQEDASCDLLVVGSGIAGLSSAYEAAAVRRQGDRHRPRRHRRRHDGAHHRPPRHRARRSLFRADPGASARTMRGSITRARSRRSTGSRRSAATKASTPISSRVDGYLIPAEPSHMADLEEEYDACRKLGRRRRMGRRGAVSAAGTERARCDSPTRGASTRSNIARAGLAIQKHGGRLYGDTVYVGHDEEDDGVTIKTESGPSDPRRRGRVRDQLAGQRQGRDPHQAGADADLCRSPAGCRRAAVAGRADLGYARGLSLCPAAAAGDGQDWLIVGGEDHRTGDADDMEERFARLEEWTRERYPQLRRGRAIAGRAR